MDTIDRRPQLPSIGCLEFESSKQKDDSFRPRNSDALSNLSKSNSVSPTSHYTSGPVSLPNNQSYALPSSQYSTMRSSSQSSIKTPPESRRSSGGEREEVKPTRQSLPSISDVLAGDSSKPFTTPRTPAGESQFSSHQPYSQPHARPSSNTAPYAAVPPQEASSAASEQPHTISRTMNNKSSFTYGYQPYTAHYSNAPPPLPPPPPPPSQPAVSSGPVYQPANTFGQPPSLSTGWRSEGGHRSDEQGSGRGNFSVSENVKRHLDFYDLEMALNDIAHASGALTDFSRRYGDRMHMSQRAGPSLAMLPSIIEIDDMIAKSRSQCDSLVKVREVILTQQAAYEQQAADQHQHQKLMIERQQRPSDVAKSSGLAGPETSKKRRGRPAPPGRCHGCNRAETPEWRRGPDGARTLCNACGLHYAKLTRRGLYAKQSTAPGSSNLRPKENGV